MVSIARVRFGWLGLAMALAGCGLLPGTGSKDGGSSASDICPDPDPGDRLCGHCEARQRCYYCADVGGRDTCPADPCGTTCDSSRASPPDGGSSSGGGGDGGGGPHGGNGPDTNQCPAAAMLQCSQWTTSGECSIQSCTCYYATPTAYCGVYYHTDDGAFFWCGGGPDCSALAIQACAQRVATYCTPPAQ